MFVLNREGHSKVMDMLNIVIYGTGLMGRELLGQIECYNRINKEKHIGESVRVLAFTETICNGGVIRGVSVIALEDCAKLQYDMVIIASSAGEKIVNMIKNARILDSRKVIRREEFYPENNGLTLSQINTAYFYEKSIQFQDDLELKELYRRFQNKNNFVDILNRRRFIEEKEEIERYRDVQIFYDDEEALKYVFFNGKRLYYPAEWSDEKIKEYHALNVYTCTAETSAHRYLDSDFDVREDDIVADIGTAEGLFALEVVDRVKMVYLFEADHQWMRSLHATFKPYKEKVVFENKFVSNINQWEFITCDNYFRDKEITLIKMDIEGEEQKALLGSKNLLKRENLRWLITTYHRSEDMEFIDAFMRINGYITEKVGNWLWIDQSNLDIKLFGEFRKAMLRARKMRSMEV